MSGIYLHIPFCDTKCIYCDFYSITNHSTKELFIKSLIKEIKDKSTQLTSKNFDTIFFGGGTPSLLSNDDFNLIFDVLYSALNISDKSEITIEANPGTLGKEKLIQLKKLPINRISFGVQSFIDSELKFLTRIHSSEEAINAIKSAQDAGFENINLDLIFALPGQTMENWKYNLETAFNLNTQHISAYSLIFEEGTYLNTLLS
ncbi:MAG: radical SAM family heme chaperone HemW, partial [Ignavibacteria bacterium]